jgi:nitronate monooxygenase
VEDFIRKGGTLEETQGRECVCNGLVGTIGLPQVNAENVLGLPLVTAGNEIANVARFLPPGRDSYTAAEVIRLLLGQLSSTAAPGR